MDTVKDWIQKTLLYHSPITETCPVCGQYMTYEGYDGHGGLQWLLDHLRESHV